MGGYGTLAEAKSVKRHRERDGTMWRIVKRGERYHVERMSM